MVVAKNPKQLVHVYNSLLNKFIKLIPRRPPGYACGADVYEQP